MLRGTIERLCGEHGEMEVEWGALRKHLARLADGGATVDAALIDHFDRLYRDHIAVEEGVVYRRSRALIGARLLLRLAMSMTRRRGIASQPQRED